MFKALLQQKQLKQQGFTLMEIVVSTTIFATTLVLMMSLFTYTLKINRRTEALRQSTQGMRNFVEFLTKEIRNGKVDYAPLAAECLLSYSPSGGSSVGIINIDGKQECFYYTSASKTLNLKKGSALTGESLNPPNFTVENLIFYVRPLTDPYGASPSDKMPFVTIAMVFKVTLPTGEVVTIPYQTSVSTDAYDVPSS